MNKRLVLTACFLTVFIAYAIRYGYGILLPEMLDTMGITKTDAGIIFSSFFIAYTIASPVCGYISDRYGSRWLLATFVVALGLGAFLMSRVSSILQASLSFTLSGIGAAACWAPVMAIAQKWTSHSRRGRTLSYIDIGSAVGIIVVGLSLPVIIKNFDWRTGWIILGAIGMAIGLLNFLVIKNPPDSVLPETDKNSLPAGAAGIPLSALLASGRFWLFSLAYMFAGYAILVPFTFLSTYAVQELSVSYAMASSFITVIGAGCAVSKFTLGPLSDKTGRLKMLFLCSALISLGCFLMVTRNVIVLFAAAVIFSLGNGAIWALYAAASSDYFPRESSGTIVGIWTLFVGIGSILSPAISGWLADATGTLTWSFCWGGIASLVSVGLLIPLWKKGRG